MSDAAVPKGSFAGRVQVIETQVRILEDLTVSKHVFWYGLHSALFSGERACLVSRFSLSRAKHSHLELHFNYGPWPNVILPSRMRITCRSFPTTPFPEKSLYSLTEDEW